MTETIVEYRNMLKMSLEGAVKRELYRLAHDLSMQIEAVDKCIEIIQNPEAV